MPAVLALLAIQAAGDEPGPGAFLAAWHVNTQADVLTTPEAVAAGPKALPEIWQQLPEWALAEDVSLARRAQQEETTAAAFPIYVSLPAVIVLVLMSGLFSGLTLGLMGLDVIQLEVVKKGKDVGLAKCAEKILPIREKGNMLLCTLLFGNVAVNSALSILSGELFSGPVGFVVSTGLIVVFGEILPQAACSRYALQVGARTVLVVRFLMIAFFVITKPMSMMLDMLLGREMGTIFSSSELMEMLKMQIELGATDKATGEMAMKVAEGALCFRDKRVEEVMIPLEDAYMLSHEIRLGYNQIRDIFMTGFSRVPVYGRDKNDYRGLLYSKDLMLADPEDEMKLGDFIAIFDRRVESVFKGDPLVDVLKKFQKGKTHMGLVRETNMESATEPKFEICGVLTLEDIVEEILQAEIVDETDVYVDVDTGVKVYDGRESKHLSLEIFNPVWRVCKERPSSEEVNAIAAHLKRSVFNTASGMNLGIRTVEWLVAVGDILNRERITPMDVDQPVEDDWLYVKDYPSDRLSLVLQGRVGLRHGREGFRSEAGAFTILAQHALKLDHFAPDFGAFLATPKLRWLSITRSAYTEAQRLDADALALEKAHRALATQSNDVFRPALNIDPGQRGESSQATMVNGSGASPPPHVGTRGRTSTHLRYKHPVAQPPEQQEPYQASPQRSPGGQSYRVVPFLEKVDAASRTATVATEGAADDQSLAQTPEGEDPGQVPSTPEQTGDDLAPDPAPPSQDQPVAVDASGVVQATEDVVDGADIVLVGLLGAGMEDTGSCHDDLAHASFVDAGAAPMHEA